MEFGWVVIIIGISFLALGVSTCREDNLNFEKWKICMEVTKDPSKCEKK